MSWEHIRNIASVATIVILVIAVATAVAAGSEYLHAQEKKFFESFQYFENRYDTLQAQVLANREALTALADQVGGLAKGQEEITGLLEELKKEK